VTLGRRVGGVLSLVALAAAGYWVATFALPMDKVPFDKWRTGLGPRLWTTWWYLGTFVLAALSFGQLLVRRTSQGARDGSWALAFSSGTISFAVAIGFFGWLGWLAHPFFWLLPLAMTFVGLPSLRDALLEARAQRSQERAFSNVEVLALLLGGCCLGLLMLQVISPDNINYDAMWYHLRSAERNALASAIARTPEGDVLLSLPSATSWLYTWAFLAPGMLTEDKVVLALHLELAVFIGTLACVPPLVRVLVPGRDRRATRVTWVALFFFPSVFIYDTGLMGGADHIVALWAATTVLTWVQARERGDTGSWVLLGVQLTGLIAKYSSLYLLIPLAPLMLGDALWRRRVRGLFVAAGVGLVLTSPYWLRNWVWHHNPIFPMASALFPNTPTNPDFPAWQRYWAQLVVLNPDAGSTAHRVRATFSALVDYHQRLYGWKDMIGDQPVMGSGYFLSLVVLPFLPERRRLFALAVLLSLGVVVWFNLSQFHFRYLTVLTPLMAAAMAATAVSLWELGLPARMAVVGACCLLLSAYADVPFRRTHRLNRGASPVENSSEFIIKRGPGSNRLTMWREIAAALPPDARPVVHGIDPQLGLPRLSITDCGGWQLAINYGRWGSTAEAWRGLRALGATHLLWTSEAEQADSVSGEAIYKALAKATVNQKVVRGFTVGELPPEAPTEMPGTHVLFVGCGLNWQTGIYSLATLATPVPPSDHPWPPLAPEEVLRDDNWLEAAKQERVGWVVQDESCKQPPPPAGYVNMGVQRMLPSYFRYFVRQR
jgi:hypothetical protein